MPQERNTAIDMLRGFSMLAMILVHATAYFTADPVARALWNIGQLAVPVFVFCSAYLYFQKAPHAPSFSSQFVKRTRRLLVPYYYYVAALFALSLMKTSSLPTLEQIFRQLTLTTVSNDPSWLVLLFFELSFVMPLVWYAWNRKRKLFWLYAAVVVAANLYLVLQTPTLHFKLTMWLPWSLVVIAALFFVRNEGRRQFAAFFTLLWLVIFGLSAYMLYATHGSLSQYDNKYPPNLYHLSYGLFTTSLLYVAAARGVFGPLRKLLSFLSLHSYSIYFVHFLIIFAALDYLRSQIFAIGWFGYFCALLITTIGAQRGLLAARRVISSRY